MISLQTNRLILRQMIESDAQFMFELNSDFEVTKYTGDSAFNNFDEALQLIRNYDQYEKYDRGRLTVVLKESNELLGWCGLKFNVDTGETDLGYRFKKQYWGKGYATEAGLVCLQDGFNRLKLDSVIATAVKENIASIKVMEKLGFRFRNTVLEHGVECVCYEKTSF